MKKIIALTLTIIMCISICACSSHDNSTKSKKENTYTVIHEDGTTEEMTHKELSDLYENQLKMEEYIGSEISGTGKIESIERKNDHLANIKLDFMNFEIHNVPIGVAKKFDKGDDFEIKGKLASVFGVTVYINGDGYYD